MAVLPVSFQSHRLHGSCPIVVVVTFDLHRTKCIIFSLCFLQQHGHSRHLLHCKWTVIFSNSDVK